MSCRIYQSPGRIRVRLSTLRSAIPEALILDLKALPGIRQVLCNEMTGSVVVYYDNSTRCSSSVLRVFRRHQLLENVFAFPTRKTTPKAPTAKQPSLLEALHLLLRRALKAGHQG